MASPSATPPALHPAPHAQLLQFAPFTSKVSPEFWHEFAALKVNQLQLSDDDVPLAATYGAGRQAHDVGVAVGSSLNVDGDAFGGAGSSSGASQFRIPVRGTLKNFNTIEAFGQADKLARFHALAQEIATGLLESDQPESYLIRFLVLAFADLKKFKFFYLFAIPAISTEPKWTIEAEAGHAAWTTASTSLGLDVVRTVAESLPEFLAAQSDGAGGAFLLRTNPDRTVQLARVSAFDQFFADIPEDQRTVGFVDPSTSDPGWPLRNLLLLLRIRFGVQRVRVLRWLDDASILSSTATGSDARSLTGVVALPAGAPPQPWAARPGTPLPIPRSSLVPTAPQAFGWERNAAGKLGPKVIDLGPLMDPKHLADQAVGLNLKLMRWRLMPSIQLEPMEHTKFLLFGAGTLGCYVARTLLGWGTKHITLVDNGKVSFSNPVRQPLYDFEDCLEGGKPKATTAAAKLRQIYPGVTAEGFQLSVPMPGHPVPPASQARVQQELETIERLVQDHDVLFLLMDSRESRWLPSMIGAAHNKIVINAALGFDTYVVMRHGAGPNQAAPTSSQVPDPATSPTRLGCYFCNDVVAPTDSLSDRTLDEMCTVSRPGLAGIAGASAVELLVSILQHSDQVRAPATPSGSSRSISTSATDPGSCLGLVPHQIRGQLAQWSTMLVAGEAYPRCTACSSYVVDAYRTQGHQFIWDVCADAAYLERLTGLDELQRAAEAMNDLDIESEEDDF